MKIDRGADLEQHIVQRIYLFPPTSPWLRQVDYPVRVRGSLTVATSTKAHLLLQSHHNSIKPSECFDNQNSQHFQILVHYDTKKRSNP